MEQKINRYKLLSIIFIIIIVVLGFLIFMKSQEVYDFGYFKIKKNTINDISQTLGGGTFRICDMEQNNCVLLKRLP